MKSLPVLALMAVAVFCFGATAHAETTLRIGLAEDPDILDPTLARTYVGRIVFAAFCDKLFDIDEKLTIVPQLALSHETSTDGREVTIKLRPGVKFHDGEPFDADAAKFSLERHLSFPTSFRKPELAALERVEVVDPLTIKLKLTTPYSPLIAQLADRAGMMISPKAAKQAGDKFGPHPLCAGPYRFVERLPQGRIIFEKFADYWNKDNVFIDKLVYLPIVDSTVRLANLKSGGLELMERLLATDISDVRADPKLKLSTALSLGYQGITINIGHEKNNGPLSQSAKVRQALDLAIDREAINQVAYNDEFVPGNQWVNPEHPYYQKAYPLRPRHLDRAKALLKDAGIGAPIVVDFMVAKNVESETVAQIIQSMAAEAGFDIRIRVTELASALKQAEAGEYQAFLLDWSGRIDADGNCYIFHKTKAPQNYSAYSNLEVDAALDDARLVSDMAQRKSIYQKMTKSILEDEPIIYLYHRRNLIAHTASLEGYKPMPDGLVRVIGLKLK